MNIIFFSHPYFIGNKSMTRFTAMLADGMKKRGHNIEVWAPQERLIRLPVSKPFKKWLGYIDQYLLFPKEVLIRVQSCPKNTLFVFTDQALGTWIPLVVDRPHVIHCHDFLAQFSARGEIPENKTGWTGRLYQAYIRKGFAKGKNFISVSKKTQEDLHTFFSPGLINSSVVYNGLNNSFEPFDPIKSRLIFSAKAGVNLNNGYLLHVGGNPWYKNRVGVIDIYDAWRTGHVSNVPLIMLGDNPTLDLVKRYELSQYKENIHFLSNIEDDILRFAYAGAFLLLFPSLDEGFGWPIIEAMACGCPVITTNKEPMTTVAGIASFFISRRPYCPSGVSEWAKKAASIVDQVFMLSQEKRQKVINAGFKNARRFDTEASLDQIELLYKKALI